MKNIWAIISMVLLIGCGSSSNLSNAFNVSVGEDKTSILDKNVTFHATVNGDYNGTLSYEWREGKKILGKNKTLIKSDFSKGEHIIDVTATDSNGLKANDRVILKVGIYVLLDEWVQQQSGVVGEVKHNSYVYDNNANLIREDSDYREPDGIVDSIIYYTYDSKKNLINEKHYQSDVERFLEDINYTYDRENNLLRIVSDSGYIKEYTYDDYGNRVDYAFTTSSKVVLKEKYTYDNRGNRLTFSFNITPHGEDYNSTTIYTYNKNNQITTQRLVFENEKRRFILGGDATELPNWHLFGINYITYTYNENSKILTENYYADENLTKKISYQYEENKVVKSTYYHSNKTDEFTYIYNSKGKLLSQTEVFNGKVYRIYTHEYDEKFNIIESKELLYSYKNSGELQSEDELSTIYENFYDELGTLIKVIQDEKYIWEKVLLF